MTYPNIYYVLFIYMVYIVNLSILEKLIINENIKH